MKFEVGYILINKDSEFKVIVTDICEKTDRIALKNLNNNLIYADLSIQKIQRVGWKLYSKLDKILD